MNMRSLNGEDMINEALTNALAAVIDNMVNENIINDAVAEEYLNSHIAILSSKSNIWTRLKTYLGYTSMNCVIILKVTKPKESKL